MLFACFWWWCMLGKNKYCSWKMNSLRLYRISGNLHGIILPQFQIPNWASIGFMRERGKGGCGQWKPLQSGGLCFKRAAWREWKPIDGEDGDEPLCFQREEETLSDQLASLLANTMAGEFGSVLPNSKVNPFSSSLQIKRALATEQSNYPMPALLLTLTELLQSHLHIQIKLIHFHSFHSNTMSPVTKCFDLILIVVPRVHVAHCSEHERWFGE